MISNNNNISSNCLSIQQPYIFPYIGYYQLINASELHVIFDTVNFKKRTWITRNRILEKNQIKYINICISHASQNKKISELELVRNLDWKIKFLKKIELAYKKAPYFNDIFPIIEKIINYKSNYLSNYLHNSIVEVCNFLEIKTKIIKSSDLEIDQSLKKHNLILSILKNLNYKKYLGLPSGKNLYDKSLFEEHQVKIYFIKNDNLKYQQFNNIIFFERLSIVDMLMNIGKNKTIKNLSNFSLE